MQIYETDKATQGQDTFKSNSSMQKRFRTSIHTILLSSLHVTETLKDRKRGDYMPTCALEIY